MKSIKVKVKQECKMNLDTFENKMIANIAAQYAKYPIQLNKFYIAGLEGLAKAYEKYKNDFDKLNRFATWHVRQSILELHNKPKTAIEQSIDKVNCIFDPPSIEQIFEPIELPMITRLEVIDINGRSYVNWETENKVSLNFQDNGLTLKVSIK